LEDNLDSRINLLKTLSEINGPSGYEEEVRNFMREALDPLVDQIDVDQMGSIIGRLGVEDNPRIMLSAHMDELGLMVRYITEEGYLKIHPLGGWLDQAIVNQRWIILTDKGTVPGITGIKTIHVMKAEDRKKVFDRDSLFIDIGAKNREDVIKNYGIRPGDAIVPDSKFGLLGDGDLLLGKAWDDRVGLAVMIEVLRRIAKSEVTIDKTIYFVATVQEEIGLRGAKTSSYAVSPDIAINLEAGVAADFPGMNNDESQERLGLGPTVFLHDSSMIPNIKLRKFVMEVAENEKIPIQFNVLNGYGQDGAEAQRSRSGTPAINIAVPTRYLHSHNGVISMSDFDQTVQLITALMQKMNSDEIKTIRQFI